MKIESRENCDSGCESSTFTSDFLKWTPLHFDTSIFVKMGVLVDIKNEMTNSVDPNEMAHYEMAISSGSACLQVYPGNVLILPGLMEY